MILGMLNYLYMIQILTIMLKWLRIIKLTEDFSLVLLLWWNIENNCINLIARIQQSPLTVKNKEINKELSDKWYNVLENGENSTTL